MKEVKVSTIIAVTEDDETLARGEAWLTGVDLNNDQQLADLTTKVLESYKS